MVGGGGGNIKVVVRCRPFNSREKDRNATCIVQMKGTQTVLTPPPGVEKVGKGGSKDHGPKVFNFDRSYWSFSKSDPSYAGQDNLFEDLGQPLLDNAFGGYNNCIFAYGQTGSGKSYSMMGYGEEYGVIPRICQNMFERINDAQRDPNLKCTVEVSYLEIYNEKVRDLLNPTTKGNLKVREHPATGPYVEDLAKLVVGSFNEIENLMDEGNKARTVAATNMNETSSRSHAVFTLILTQKRHDDETNMDTEKVSRISLVDLAGSERANSTGATGARLKEGAEINRSLSTLGRVIAALADLSSGKVKGKKSANLVPYRDSVLTWLLKDSLGGNSMTAMIAAISPADINYDETLSTLRYADSAKRIKNHAVVNEDPNARMIRELKEELQQLRAKLSTGGGVSEEVYDASVPPEKQIVTITTSDGQVKKVSKAEIAEQLQQSEKILTDLNQTWEERLEKTQKIHKERETALEELGISIEKGFVGLSTPKRIPHLVNLSDDPLLAECLVYNIKPGVTHVGNVETSTTAQIRLNGSKILEDHCRFENDNGVVTLFPNKGAAVMVNGLRIEEPKRLRTGYRVILGDFHIFRFNHPQEARAERDKLRQSVTINSAQMPYTPEHRHTMSNGFSIADTSERTDLDNASSRAESPAPIPNSRDMEWSFARREAASALLGDGSRINTLSNDELDALLEEAQRVKAIRQGRPDSRLDDDDTESTASYMVRDKYASTTTFDDMSLDTSLTLPSTPHAGESEERLRLFKEEMQAELEKQKEEYQERLQAAAEANVEVEEIKAERVRMQQELDNQRVEMQKELEKQRQEFESRIEQLSSPQPKHDRVAQPLTKREKSLARAVFGLWKQRRYVRMAESILQNAAVLKEAQIMSNEMEKNVVFQFTIVDEGHNFASSYDLVLNGISAEEDEFLDIAKKPCVGVRVMDFHAEVVHLWSLEKLQNRVRQMRQIYQYLDRPEYLQHFRVGDPFSEPNLPRYSLIGDVDVPLTAVFEHRSQEFSLDLVSPHTQSVIGIIRLVLEPSEAESRSIMKFNVHIIEVVGFAEREGTDVHAQMFIPGVSEEGGATTTTMFSGFNEGSIKFNSVHSISVPLRSSIRKAPLRIALFAKITPMHLEKLISWDDMRDHSTKVTQKKKKTARLNEQEFYSEERHDVFVKAQILELSETGEYLPVEVLQQSEMDTGSFQLHQGLQRRVQLSLTHNSGQALQWSNVNNLRIGSVRLLDPRGKVPDMSSPTKEVSLSKISGPVLKMNLDGTCTATVIAQWDSSLHNSILLDRATAANYRVQMSLRWNATSDKLSEPILFSLDIAAQMQPRLGRSPSKFMQLWSNTRVLHSTVGLYQLVIRPAAARKAGDLWRMNTVHRYVKGEEYLSGWVPRGVSLVRDFISAKRKKLRLSEVENARGFLNSLPTTRNVTPVPPASRNATPVPPVSRNATPVPPVSRNATPVPPVSRNATPVPPSSRNASRAVTPIPPTRSMVPDTPSPAPRNPQRRVGEYLDPTAHLDDQFPDHVSELASFLEATPNLRQLGENANHGAVGETLPPLPPASDEEILFFEKIKAEPPQMALIDDDYSLVAHTFPTGLGIAMDGDIAAVEQAVANRTEIHEAVNEHINHIGQPHPVDDHETALLRKFVNLWSKTRDPSEVILVQKNTEPPMNGTSFVESSSQPPRLIAEVRHVPKSSSVLKSGYLLTPDDSNRVWIKRYFELRRPYMHVHSVPDGEEIAAINLSQCRIDHEPQVARLLRRPNIFAIYGPTNTYLFAARNDREMIEWIMKVDQFHFFSESRSGTPDQ